jgi:NarL family two-component system sensor histidine kinase LiaS
VKKYHYVLLLLYSSVIISAIVFITLDSLGLKLQDLITDFWILEQFVFSIVFLILAVMILLLLLWVILDDNSKRSINQNLRRILNNQPLKLDEESEINVNLQRLSKKMSHLTTSIQNTENTKILKGQEIVKQERKRIARDLHDTVSQELFASSMILSGVSMNIDQMEKDQLQTQLLAVEDLLQNAQKDLRILLLHLRPTELENKTLSEGFDMILKELTDKSDIEVVYQKNIDRLPKAMEDNLFRIAQEFISNTLKHARASRLEVYLIQSETEVQLKMVDDGCGFDMDTARDLSYGLTNIEDRVDDMAGTIKLLSQPGKGVSMDIRLPLVKEETVEEDIVEEKK